MEAIPILQGFARCILSRKRLIARANTIYRRIYDEDSDSWYYANIHTGHTSWSKPAFYLSQEPPILLPEEMNKRSPRYQRVHTIQ
jgi:hypothetical protein